MNAIITIQAQYQENYSDDANCPRWKNKGGQTFTVEINSDILMYGTNDLVPHLKALLVAESNEFSNYIYVEHDVAFNKVQSLSQATLEATIQKEYAETMEAQEESMNAAAC